MAFFFAIILTPWRDHDVPIVVLPSTVHMSRRWDKGGMCSSQVLEKFA